MTRLFRYIASLLMIICFADGLRADDSTAGHLVRRTETSTVNWTEGILSAVGRGVPPETYYGDEKGRDVALAEAIASARDELMTAISGISIDADSKVADLVEENRAVRMALRGMVDMAEVVHQEFTTDGTVDVTVQMNMSGGFSQLVLPKVVKQIESVRPISGTSGNQTEGDGISAENDVVSGPYSGMIVDVRGIDIAPCLSPRVYDENGQEIFGPAYASREFAVQHGMAGYISDMEIAAHHPRVADRPLILKGLRTSGTDIIVSNTDAARLRSAFENLAFLRQCRVVIVLDAPDTDGEG